MELIAPYARLRCGMDFLFESKLIEWLVDLSCHRHTQSQLLGSQAIRELGNILRIANENNIDVPWGKLMCIFKNRIFISNFTPTSIFYFLGKLDSITSQHFLSGVQSYLDSSDSADRIAGIFALATYGGSGTTALCEVLQNSHLLESWRLCFRSINEVRAAALNSVALILDSTSLSTLRPSTIIDASSTSSITTNDLKRTLVQQISLCFNGAPIVTYLLKIARAPTETLKHAALNLLRSIASNTGGWGVQMLIGDSEFLRYIEDSTTECSKVSMEMKFSCVDALWRNTSRDMLSEDVVRRIEVIIKRGPFFVSARMAEPLTI